ncbi:MAG: pyridoxamine 5'-phosphate oxidase family protein, partial [Clostridia bacterium]
MDYRKEFERMMRSQTAIALATSVDGFPNVRIVNFYYDTNQKTLYFSTF